MVCSLLESAVIAYWLHIVSLGMMKGGFNPISLFRRTEFDPEDEDQVGIE